MQWYMYILWALLWIVVAVVGGYLLIWLVTPYFINPKKEYDKNSKFYRWLLNSSTGIAMKIMRIRIITTGFEKIPEDSRFLLVCNHRSNYDPIVSWYAFRKYTPAYISKPENFDVPIYGRMIRKCCFMSIDRQNPRNSMTTIIRAIKLINSNEVSVAVYPEGTRSKKLRLLKFHNGVFKIAQKAGVPIVIATIQGTEKVYKNYPWKHSDIHIDILDVVPAEVAKEQKTETTAEYARNLMLHYLPYEENKAELDKLAAASEVTTEE